MTWIKTIQPEEATGELAQIYRKLHEKGKPISNVVQAYSVKPVLLRTLRNKRPHKLPPRQRIRVSIVICIGNLATRRN